MAYMDEVMMESTGPGMAPPMGGPGMAPPMGDPGMGGGPQDEVGQLLELRGQIDQRLMELGVPAEAMASPDIAPPMAPPMPPMDPAMAMGGGGMPMGPGGPPMPPQAGLLG
jgi:hypothetical protein